MTTWGWLICAYVVAAIFSLLPTLYARAFGVKLHKDGASFNDSKFSADGKTRLIQHYSRLDGTLKFWKREATVHGRFHWYCLCWTILSSSLMPFLTQVIDASDIASKWFLTTVAAHIALLLGFHRGVKVAERYRAFRHGESEFYDMYRRLLDRPETFGSDEKKQIETYFEEVEIIRRFVRNAETDNLPSLEVNRAETSGLKNGA